MVTSEGVCCNIRNVKLRPVYLCSLLKSKETVQNVSTAFLTEEGLFGRRKLGTTVLSSSLRGMRKF